MQEKPDKIRPALFGGITIAIISTVPGLNFVNCFCCAGVIFGGFLAVYFYNKNLQQMENVQLTYNDGMVIGLMAGAFGAIIGSILSSVIGTNLQQQINKMMQYSEEFPPELEDALYKLSEEQSTMSLIIIGLIMSLIIYCIFALLGGIIGVSIFNKKKAV